MGGDVYMAEFNPIAYLQHFRFEEGTLWYKLLRFILEHYKTSFTSGRSFPKP